MEQDLQSGQQVGLLEDEKPVGLKTDETETMKCYYSS
jgi:hypothetical protein